MLFYFIQGKEEVSSSPKLQGRREIMSLTACTCNHFNMQIMPIVIMHVLYVYIISINLQVIHFLYEHYLQLRAFDAVSIS